MSSVNFQHNINLVVEYNYLLKEDGATSFIYMINLLRFKCVEVQLYGFFSFKIKLRNQRFNFG